MKKLYFKLVSTLTATVLILGLSGCDKYLNVVPDDGIPTIDMSFNLRSTAIRYLSTCYSYMPLDGAPAGDSAFLTGDELWDLIGRVVSNTSTRVPNSYFQIARGIAQSSKSVIANDWPAMYQGIRCCDILVDNIERVPDMTRTEKQQWKAEVTFLKAYYHFNLIRKWGPVPIIRESLPMDADIETVRVHRAPIDSCFNFVLELLDKAMPDLPLTNVSNDEYGRITQAICAAFKARVAVYAASPLFNGNEEEATLLDKDGTPLFPQKTAEQKLERWTYAVTACKEAIETCDKAERWLYDVQDLLTLPKFSTTLSDTLKRTLALRAAMSHRWNHELIWGNTQTGAQIQYFQQWTMPNMTDYTHTTWGYNIIGVPLKIVDQFYTRNGLPTGNDLEWEGANLMELREGTPDHSYYLQEGYTTARMNFQREPRFYAFLGFDGGKWLDMMTSYNEIAVDDIPHIECRNGTKFGKGGSEVGPVTGYFPKKLCPPLQCAVTGANASTTYWYPWPMMRLADLYLLYAEAINEAEGPNGPHSEDLFKYLNAVRARAGIPDVKTAWEEHSNNPGYYNSQYGMRNIIHRERLIELCFESQRFWDIRRWKEAPAEYQKGIYGFTLVGSTAEDYYVRKLVASQSFGLKDYFWPIQTSYIDRNPNLVQNLGW